MKFRIAASLLLLTSISFAQTTTWTAVEEALGRKGSAQPGGVYKFALPRTDLKVTVGNVQLKPALALGGWLAFEGEGPECMVMGDLVLQESEIPAVVAAALPHQIQITAIHNHVLNESPRVMYMHVGGHFMMTGKEPCAVVIGRAMKDVIVAAHVPPQTPPAPSQGELGFDQAAVEKAMGASGKINGGVLQFSVPRKGAVAMHGFVVPPSMGVATAINFQPVGQGQAAITGDFVMTSAEVQKVIAALHAGGIQVTALHSHMLDEEPRLFFMHFWAVDDAIQLAGTLRKALDQIDK